MTVRRMLKVDRRAIVPGLGYAAVHAAQDEFKLVRSVLTESLTHLLPERLTHPSI